MKLRSACAAALLLLATGCDRGSHPGQIGSVAPTFSIHNDTGAVNLEQYRGRVVILNFWATWCAPCIEELPSLQSLQQQMPDVQVLAISIDDDADAYRQFLTQNHISLLSVRDGSEGANQKFGSVRVPETFVLDRKGVMRRKFIGPQEWTNPEILSYLSKL